ncbi:cytochrome P450 [Nonomuraea sp. MG754425]|uniref:cytochrome P450 n=1 Tax=Nonomuraea sp. MG754425 TaxID=2570319 RepID=UPI001F356205|nr:cytochrome P450 [Nonomuraea sp. MG754425]
MTAVGTRPVSPASRGSLPPGPPGWAAPALYRRLVADRLALMSKATGRYGDAVRMTIGPKTIYVFNHPDHAKHVLADNSANYRKGIGLSEARRVIGDGLLTSDGPLWREQRRTIQPLFQNKRLARYDTVVAEEAAGVVERLRAHAGGGPVDVAREMTGLALGVLGRTLLDADLGAHASLGHAFEGVQDQAMFEMVTLSMAPLFLPLPLHLRFRRARGELRRIVDELVAARLRNPTDGSDLLSLLIASTRSLADPWEAQRRLRAELITVLLAGHETTASTLSWAFHLLDRHPEVCERVRAEATEVLGDRPPVFEDLRRLTFTAQVIEEVMRLYPPVWALTRVARESDEVGGFHVPAGTDVLICPYTLHRHPAYWSEPDRFLPERFDPAAPAERPRYAYIPFGAGPRFCVGNHLGMMEATFVLAMVCRDLRLTGLPDAGQPAGQFGVLAGQQVAQGEQHGRVE